VHYKKHRVELTKFAAKQAEKLPKEIRDKVQKLSRRATQRTTPW